MIDLRIFIIIIYNFYLFYYKSAFKVEVWNDDENDGPFSNY